MSTTSEEGKEVVECFRIPVLFLFLNLQKQFVLLFLHIYLSFRSSSRIWQQWKQLKIGHLCYSCQKLILLIKFLTSLLAEKIVDVYLSSIQKAVDWLVQYPYLISFHIFCTVIYLQLPLLNEYSGNLWKFISSFSATGEMIGSLNFECHLLNSALSAYKDSKKL